MDRARLLLADDEREIRETYAEILAASGHEVDTAADGDEALRRVSSVRYDLALIDLVFPPEDGVEVLKKIKKVRPSTLVVLISGYASVENVLRGFRAGAFDFLEKPLDPSKLHELAERALDIRKMGETRRRMAEELENERLKVLQLKQQLALDDPFSKFIGNSAVTSNFIDTIREVARTESTVLLSGESGTGKSLVARTIHEASSRREHPFVEANCVVYSEGILHSELFGHERGAFTGAARTKKGRFELAKGGTLFLDEIGEIPAATQLMLLRVLQERSFERVGGEETLEADVRLIAASNRDLQEAIQNGEFRSDLYYRLNVIPVHLPPLREHPDDIAVMAQHFLTQCASKMARDIEGFSQEAIEALVRYPWPGNVRELENMIERIVVLGRSRTVMVQDLPMAVREAAKAVLARGMPGSLQEMERLRIIDALHEARGNKKLAAETLGIHRSTLYAKLRRYDLLDHMPSGNGDGRERRQSETEIATPVLSS
jgi:two-component system response regulator HydG